MKPRQRSPAALLATIVCTGLLWPGLIAAETFKIDPDHSFFMFRATRFSVANVYGRFNEFKGTLEIEGDDFESGSIEIEIRTRSVDTGNSERDDHLRGPDFLNSKQIPVMTFKSDSIRFISNSRFSAAGKMTLLGVTKPVEAEVDLVGLTQSQGTKMIGFDGAFTIKRSDFGMSFMVGPLSDEIEIHFAIQALSR